MHYRALASVTLSTINYPHTIIMLLINALAFAFIIRRRVISLALRTINLNNNNNDFVCFVAFVLWIGLLLSLQVQ